MKTFATLSGFAAVVAAAPFPSQGTGLPSFPSGGFPVPSGGFPFPSGGFPVPSGGFPVPSGGRARFSVNGTSGPYPTGLPLPSCGTGLPPLPSGGFPGFPHNGTHGHHPHHPAPSGTAPPQPEATGVTKRAAQFGHGFSFPGAASPTGGLSGASGSLPSFSFPTGGFPQPTGVEAGSKLFARFSVPTGFGSAGGGQEGGAAPTGLPGFGGASGSLPSFSLPTGGFAQPTGIEEGSKLSPRFSIPTGGFASPSGLPGFGGASGSLPSFSLPTGGSAPFATGGGGASSGVALPTGSAATDGRRGRSGKITSPSERVSDAEEDGERAETEAEK